MSMRALFAAGFLFACGGNRDGGAHGELVSLEVEPANQTIAWTGSPASLDYTAIAHWEDGTVEPVTAAFSLDAAGTRLGAFTDQTFAVGGTAAGKGEVIASVGEITGSTSVIVTLHTTNYGVGVDPGAETNFPESSAPGAFSQALVYPLNNAVMPSSVKAPTLQWEGPTVGGDLYRVRLRAGFATVDTILADTPTASYAPTANDWSLLKNSIDAGTVTMTVDHWDATNGAQGGAPVDVKVVPAEVIGAIYYWNLDAGEMERIDANGRAKAIPTPPEMASEPGNRCVACHTVSRDGRYLSGSMWGGGREGAVFDLTSNAVKNSTPAAPAPTVSPLVQGSTYTQLFTTFNPDGTRLMINGGANLFVIDPHTGATVTTGGTPLPTAGASHPAWSPDGTSIAYISNCTMNGAPAGGVDYNSGDLSIIPVTGPDTFGPSAPIATAGAQGGGLVTPSWPSFSPDSQWIAYGAGTFSRGNMSGIEYPGALFMINKTGGTPVRLDKACVGNALRCYLPNFSPFDAGGYYWLIYYSFQDYGNAQAGTKGTSRRQMWITAIDKSKLGSGEDPSSVPYWLPDQDLQTMNMSAFWSLPVPIL